MAVKVVGTWELGWNTPIKEVEQWQFVLKEFAVDLFVMSPVSGIVNSYTTEVPDIGAFIASERDAGTTIVFVDEGGVSSLPDFVHPSDADGDVLYVFGKSSVSPLSAFGKEGDLSLCIPTATNCGGFWPHQAAAILLYDRFLKG